MLVLVLALFLLLPLTAHAADRYATPTGGLTSGTCSTTGTACTVQQGLAAMAQGDTLWLANGVYTGTAGMLRVPVGKHGTSAARYTVKATNEGKVRIDGQYAREPVVVDAANYWTIEGLNACCSSSYVVRITNGSVATHVRRTIAWDANDTDNVHIWNLVNYTRDTLLEDIAAWGSGRKTFEGFKTYTYTLKRGFFIRMFSLQQSISGVVNGCYSCNERNTILNTIGSADTDPRDLNPIGSAMFSDVRDIYSNSNIHVLHQWYGNIAYHSTAQRNGKFGVAFRIGWPAAEMATYGHNNANSTEFKNNIVLRRTDKKPAEAFSWQCDENPNTTVRPWSKCTIKDNYTESDGTLSGGTHRTESGVKSIGAFNGGLLQTNATTQPSDGAWIRYRYNTNGTLSTEELWPWPMEARIRDAMIESGYSARGLDGEGELSVTNLMMRLSGSTVPTSQGGGEEDPTPQTHYISPTGLDTNTGASAGQAWKTFAHALSSLRLHPGDVLILVNGTYTPATTGLPIVNCGTTNRTGTAALPITLRAQTPRQAHLQSDGTRDAFQLTGCSYWTLDGLRLSVTGDQASPVTGHVGGPVVVTNSTHITLTNLLVDGANRYKEARGIQLTDTTQSLVANNEVYNQHRHGIIMDGTTIGSGYNVIRQNYVHSRGVDDLPGGLATLDATRGDRGIYCRGCNNSIIENNITEDWMYGVSVLAAFQGTTNNRFLGNVDLGSTYGAHTGADTTPPVGLEQMPRQTEIRDHVSVGARSAGIYLQSPKGTLLDQVTAINGAGTGLLAVAATAPGDGTPTFTASNLLLVGNTTLGLSVDTAVYTGTAWSVTAPWLDGNGTPSSPTLTDSHITQEHEGAPELSSCLAYVPGSSPAATSGVGGMPIGARVYYQRQGGTITGVPLWDATTNNFPCGAVVAGVNDAVGTSCQDVDTRLNIRQGGCPDMLQVLPPGPMPGVPGHVVRRHEHLGATALPW